MTAVDLPKLLLSRRDVCEVTGFGLTKVTKLLGDGTIPSVKIGGQRRIRYSDLVDYINSLKTDRTPLPDQPTLTLAEVAEITGFSRRSIEDGCRDGVIAHRHFGRQRVMTWAHVFEFLAATEVAATPKNRAVPAAEAAEVERIEGHRSRVADRLSPETGSGMTSSSSQARTKQTGSSR